MYGIYEYIGNACQKCRWNIYPTDWQVVTIFYLYKAIYLLIHWPKRSHRPLYVLIGPWPSLFLAISQLKHYLCPGRPCFSSSDVFLFCWAAFLSISLLASVFPVSLPLFFLFLRPCLIHARMPDWGRAFVHGHTFLHSWTHFLAFMDTLSCIHGHTFLHSWTHFLAFMDTLSCIHGHTFLHSWTHFLAFMDTLSCIHGVGRWHW